MNPHSRKLRIFAILIVGIFVLGIAYLVTSTISQDTSLNQSSADVKNVACGNADTNQNNVLDIVDYGVLKDLVGKNCTDTPASTLCGPMDMNGDGVINLKDLSLFGARYNQPNCGLPPG